MKLLHYWHRMAGALAILCCVVTLNAQRHMASMHLPPDPVGEQTDADYPHFFDYFNQITTTGLLQDRSPLRSKFIIFPY